MTATATRPRWTVKRTDGNVTAVILRTDSRAWEQWFLLRSDAHHDNVHCLQDLEKKHLDQAKEREAGIIDCGDLHCAMQGKYDPRSDKGALREEYKAGSYLDRLVDVAADFYRPYSRNFLLMGHGNHETAILTRLETDLTARVTKSLNDSTGSQIVAGGYTGWILFRVSRGDGSRITRRLWYTHGYGGGGPVTKDMIQANRQRNYLDGIDYQLSGHTHDSWYDRQVRIGTNGAGKEFRKTVHVMKLGCYKDEYGDGSGGWSVGKGHPPKPLGAWWLRLYWEGDTLKDQIMAAD
jgi:hypothetical protein